MADFLYSYPGVVERQKAALNGATYVTVVPAPGEGNIAQVAVATVVNNTAGAIDLTLWHNDGRGSRTELDKSMALAANGVYTSAARYPIILLRDFDYLEMTLGAAGTPVYYTAWTLGVPVEAGGRVLE